MKKCNHSRRIKQITNSLYCDTWVMQHHGKAT